MCTVLAQLAPHNAVRTPEITNFWTGISDFGSALGPPTIPTLVLMIFWAVFALTALGGLLCLAIPLPKTAFLPPLGCDMLRHRGYTGLVLADCISHLGSFLDLLHIAYLLMAGFQRDVISMTFALAGAAGAVLTLSMCCIIISDTRGVKKYVLAAVALGTFPPSLLGSLAAMSSHQLTMLWANMVPFLLGVSIALTAVKRSATSLLVIFTMPSRFKYVTLQRFATIFLTI